MSAILTARSEDLQSRLEAARCTINELAELSGQLRVAAQTERLRREAAERDLSSIRAEHAAMLAAVAAAPVAEAVYPPMEIRDIAP